MQVLAPTALALRVITHNIRYDANPPSTGEATWSQRLPLLMDEFRTQLIDAPPVFVCLQEALRNQVNDMQAGLMNITHTPWTSIGVGRDDGRYAGEYSPIFYQPSEWDLKHMKYFWLSETPDHPSLGWDAGSIRIVTIGAFRHQTSSEDLVVLNTHLDNSGSVAREKGAKLILAAIKAYTNGTTGFNLGPLPVFLAGDMNSEEDQEAYQVLSASDSPIKDVKLATPSHKVHGSNRTFTDFDDSGKGRLDYVFATKEFAGKEYWTLPNLHRDANNTYSSDHRAVVADILLRTQK